MIAVSTNNNSFVNREKRFEVTDKRSFDTLVSRAGAEDSLFYGELIDFSRNGMKLNVPFFARFDEILKVRFTFKSTDLAYAGNLRVRHLRNVDENSWQVGCSCDPPLPEEVISYFAAQNHQERRNNNRQDVKGIGFVRRQGSVETCDAEILNISEGGFCLSVSESYEVGERIDFTVFNSEGNQEAVEGRVRWQQENDNVYQIGCSFAASESYPNLMTCLSPAEDEMHESESFPTHLLAAAMLAMILPSIMYFFLHLNNGSSVAQKETATVSKVVTKTTSPQTMVENNLGTEDKNVQTTDDTEKKLTAPEQEMFKPANLAKQELKQLEKPVPQPTSRINDQPHEEKLAEQPVAPISVPDSGAAIVVQTDSKTNEPERPALESYVPFVPSSEIKSSPIPQDIRNVIIRRSGAQSGIPEELTKAFQIDEQRIGKSSSPSSRRIKYNKTINIPSEEIPTKN